MNRENIDHENTLKLVSCFCVDDFSCVMSLCDELDKNEKHLCQILKDMKNKEINTRNQMGFESTLKRELFFNKKMKPDPNYM